MWDSVVDATGPSVNSSCDALPSPGCPTYFEGRKVNRMSVQCAAIRESFGYGGCLQRQPDIEPHQLRCKSRKRLSPMAISLS